MGDHQELIDITEGCQQAVGYDLLVCMVICGLTYEAAFLGRLELQEVGGLQGRREEADLGREDLSLCC